jgi:hypothetical protein
MPTTAVKTKDALGTLNPTLQSRAAQKDIVVIRHSGDSSSSSASESDSSSANDDNAGSNSSSGYLDPMRDIFWTQLKYKPYCRQEWSLSY